MKTNSGSLRLCSRVLPPPGDQATQNLTNYETLKRTFHNTSARCHDNGISFSEAATRD